MQTPTSLPAGQPPTARRTIGYALLAAAVGALTATLTVFVAFFVLNPTVITQSGSVDAFTFSLLFLGGPHMLVCGPPGCLVGALAAALPGLLIARTANRSRGALLVVLAAALVVGVLAGVVTQWGMVLLYNYLLPCGPAGQLFTC